MAEQRERSARTRKKAGVSSHVRNIQTATEMIAVYLIGGPKKQVATKLAGVLIERMF